MQFLHWDLPPTREKQKKQKAQSAKTDLSTNIGLDKMQP